MQIQSVKSYGVAAGIAVLSLALLTGCGKSGGSLATVATDEMSMGKADAPITLIEYASVACPICAHVNETLMPDLKAKYIDTGKVRYVYRPMNTGSAAVATAGHRLAECAGKDKYFKVIDAVMRSQEAMGGEETGYANAQPVLLNIAQSTGLSEEAFKACITDEAALKRLSDLNEKYLTKDGVNGTPTFFVNGKKVTVKTGTIADFDAAFKPLLAGK